MSVAEGPHNMSTDQMRERGRAMIDRASLRLSATLLLAGQLLYIVVTQFRVTCVKMRPEERRKRHPSTPE